MSPNQVFPLDSGPLSPIAARVLENQNLTYDVSDHSLVIADRRDLLVRRSVRVNTPRLNAELSQVAENFGSLAEIERGQRPESSDGQADGAADGLSAAGPMGDIEVWRIQQDKADAGINAIDEARRLRGLADDQRVASWKGPALVLPAVSPNHVGILAAAEAGGCPAGPPHPAPPPRNPFVEPLCDGPTCRVTVLDSGYIYIKPPHPAHAALDARIDLVRGERLNAAAPPPLWVPDDPDRLYTDAAGQLDGISGHGTFIAGLIAHGCPQARLTVVGLRNQEVKIVGLNPVEQLALYETEVAITRAMLMHADTDVVQCGFAFPTLDDYPSLPFASAMQVLRGPDAPRRGIAVVAPAGNEQSPNPYWPAALPDVIGVAATNSHGTGRAWFSNWGRWCDCCARGEHVFSTFVYWDGSVEGEPPSVDEDFAGWARWDGTSFAAPKVSAAIAAVLAAGDGTMLPVDAWEQLITGATDVAVNALTDHTLNKFPGVTLKHLRLG